MRLIDADKLRDALQNEIDKASPPYNDTVGAIRCGVRLARNILEDTPTIDAIPIVRCNNCKWWKTNYTWSRGKCNICAREAYEPLRNGEDFCSYGERREDAEKTD